MCGPYSARLSGGGWPSDRFRPDAVLRVSPGASPVVAQVHRDQERPQPLRVFGMLVRLDVTVAFQFPDARLGMGGSEDLGLLVGDYGVCCGVDDEERYTLIRESRGIFFRYHLPGVEVGEEPPCEQDRRLEQ